MMIKQYDDLTRIQYEIRDLGLAAAQSGNEKISSRCFQWAREIAANVTTMSRLEQARIDYDFELASERSKTVLEATLAGAELARRESTKEEKSEDDDEQRTA